MISLAVFGTPRLRMYVYAFASASGLSVLLQYKQGSSRQGKGSAKYRVPDMAWVGLRPSQLDDLDLPEQARISRNDLVHSDMLSI